VTIGALDLTAPIPAVLAASQPVLLPLLALAMIAALAGLRAVTSRTAQAGTDPLTGVPNRAYLLDRLRARLSAHDIDRHPVLVLLVDLDRFKQINDQLGHLVGDRVLVEVAHRLADALRSTDVVARFGGDEFAVLLSGGSGQPQPQEVAARIRASVGRPIDVGGRWVRVGITVGWSQADRHDTDPMVLLQRADARLYAAKAARPARRGAADPASAAADPAADPATDPAAGPDAAVAAGPDTSPETGPESGPESGPDLGRPASPVAELRWEPLWTGTPAGILPAHDGDARSAPAR
jgi:diguanylate cyclase (GGDEF)-like protein